MSSPRQTSESLELDPLLFAKNLDELTVIGSSNQKIDEYSERVYSDLREDIATKSPRGELQTLHSTKATIFELTEFTIRLKLNNDVFVNIPRAVFSEKSDILKYGQSVVYSIKKRQNGFRFQDIDIDTTSSENPHKQRVQELIRSIPRRT